MIKTRKFILILLIIFISSCKSETKEKPKEEKQTTQNKVDNSDELEVFDVDKMLFNGKSKRYFSLQEFETNFGKIDSTKLMSEEQPCSYIFENKDGSKDMEDKYLYKDGSRFENNKDQVAIDEFRFNNNNFLKYDTTILNSSTTTDDLKLLFPNAVRKMDTLDVLGEGKLQVIQLKEDDNNISDGHINLFLKNGKLYYMHWWFPC
ncbi:hypothetical protein [Empedobacter sedimenti]|uniref:hypothetical protein n=1 Tax=Empedobacter sedimenti TaxID=3042610 RepID=UPI0024A66122|nr:hypothetical protein [Empedobacter sedimenti]